MERRHSLTVSLAMQEKPCRHRGRQVKYQGDPNAPGLDAKEHRQLLRFILCFGRLRHW